jgi:hypothetical protein
VGSGFAAFRAERLCLSGKALTDSGEAAPRRCGRDARGPSNLLELLFETVELLPQLFEFRLENFHVAFQFGNSIG